MQTTQYLTRFSRAVVALLFTALVAAATMSLAETDKATGQADTDKDKVDHCEHAVDKAREAANDFGHGNLGDAAAHAGEAAGAAAECAKDKAKDKRDPSTNKH